MTKEIKSFIDGCKEFRRKNFINQQNSIFKYLVEKGQKPKALVIACCDSRVDPALLMNCQAGDLFVVRNVANLVPPYEDDGSHHGTSAALEFGICNLGIQNIIILGHSKCGGIAHLVQNFNDSKNTVGQEKDTFISRWMDLAKKSVIDMKQDFKNLDLVEKVDICSQKSIINSLNNLKTFPWIRERIKKNELFIHGWFFELEDCSVKFFDHKTGRFN